ncbi:helix-turn-helix domain-containing protein [Campylobacterota bacterium DY0563]
MDFNLLTNEDIIKELGKNYEELRLRKKLSDEDVHKKGGVSIDAIQRLKSGSNINLINFIKILKGLGELDKLQKLLEVKEEFSLKQKAKKTKPKRIFKTKKDTNNNFIWGDEK